MDNAKAFRFVVEHFCDQDPVFAEVSKSILDLGMPDISLNPVAGKLLTLLTKMTNAERVLEIGSYALPRGCERTGSS